jgi:hypothetical protein
MEEELFPPELALSPEYFESLFCLKDPPNLQLLATEGHLQSICNRFISWRVFLGFFPEKGPISVWVDHAMELRQRYRTLVQSQTVYFI